MFFLNFLLVHTKWLKIHSDKLVPKMLCMCMYSIPRTNLLQCVLSYLIVRSMIMATRQNMPETDKVNKNIYIYLYNMWFLGNKIF